MRQGITSEMDKLTLKSKADWVRRETIRLHGLAPQTRLASSLSCVEILTVLYYGGVMSFDPKNLKWSERDRFIVSKGHGSISLYPILADLGFFPKEELEKICQTGSFLGSIPDPTVPGYETINGSLGLGPGVACGMATALKKAGGRQNVIVMSGDGELYEGSVWEAIMYAGHNKLDNITLVVDDNKACMLDYCRNIIDLQPLAEKFSVFGWATETVDGHDVLALRQTLLTATQSRQGRPKAIIANTIKGKGVPRLENDPLSHIKVLSKDEVVSLLDEE